MDSSQIHQTTTGKRSSTSHKLEEDSLRVRAVIDSMGEGLIVTDEYGLITAVNPYALKALGYREEELLGQWFSGVIRAATEDGQLIDDLARPSVRALTTGQAVSDSTYYLRKNGSLLPIFLTVSPVIIDGKPSGVIELFRDTTIERQLDSAKDDFVALASHQLRTPASGVEAVLSMLLQGDLGPLTADQQKYLRMAAQSNRRQIDIVENMLTIAQIDAGKMELELTSTDIITSLKQAAIEQQSTFKQREQTITLHHPEEVVLTADSQKIRMVIDNLMSNASKYTQRNGHIDVSVTKRPHTVELRVSDSGVGMSNQDMRGLFRKFARFDNPLSTSAGGTGLGLYLVKHIVNLHDGDIMVESAIGQGSTFRVILPHKGDLRS